MAPAKTVYEYFIVYKPFQVLSRFGVEAGKKNLKDFFPVSRNVYPVGRLDYDSEGLLILTNDPVINYRLLHPGFSHEREYWAQVEGDAGNAVLDILAAGPVISIDGKRYKTMPCKVAILPDTVSLPERNPPIRFRKNIPTSWISIILKEGKNRQVRKMTAAAGIPTLRLIRQRISQISLDGMKPGDMISISRERIYADLFGKEEIKTNPDR